ncbi:MAG: ORF6N domain-containing protein [Kiritimatiellae bacterium]|nr:ORF6N domain-containing protein [Kiritimatiellia bacterium]
MDKEANAVVPTLEDDSIRLRILTVRGVQVMLDRDLAELYGVPTKRLNEQVKRNSIRFPANFMFPLSDAEIQDILIAGSDLLNRSRSQIATLNNGRGHNIKYRPNVFTEHGIIMLASVLKSEIAALVSIRITNTFVEMRKALSSIAPLLARVEATDRRQIADQIRNDANQARNEERFKLILDAMQDKSFPPQKVFYDGQIYDAFEQMKKFVRMAKQELIVIDPYFDDSVLPLIAQKQQGVAVLVVKNLRKGFLYDVDVLRFNAQYGNTLTVRKSNRFHDRFLIIDRSTLIHVGASLNHLGKKCFAFSSMDKSNIPDILAKI